MPGRRALILFAASGSAALLAGAFWFQYVQGLLPCQLCLWQRWPHAAAVGIGVLALALGGRVLPLLGALALLVTAGIGLFHVGVEQQWWAGLESCTVNALTGVSGDDLLNFDVAVGGPVRCDVVPWQLLGISMAGWNAIASLGLALVWLAAALRR